MKVAIPTDGNGGIEEEVGEHFGRALTYTIVDVENGKIKDVRVIPNTSHHMGGVLYPPQLLSKEGVEILLCKGLGRRAILMFKEQGIVVYIGARGKVRETIDLWRRGELIKATENKACTKHIFHGEKHGHSNAHHE